jgi:hypothetical protein
VISLEWSRVLVSVLLTASVACVDADGCRLPKPGTMVGMLVHTIERYSMRMFGRV